MSVNIDVDVVARVVAIENVAAAVFIIIYPYTSYYVRAAQRASAHPDFEVSYPGYVVYIIYANTHGTIAQNETEVNRSETYTTRVLFIIN